MNKNSEPAGTPRRAPTGCRSSCSFELNSLPYVTSRATSHHARAVVMTNHTSPVRIPPRYFLVSSRWMDIVRSSPHLNRIPFYAFVNAKRASPVIRERRGERQGLLFSSKYSSISLQSNILKAWI